MMIATFHLGNCVDALKAMPDNSVDSIVTDPPYGLSFMGKKWDYDVPSVEIWAECLRVLKPGGHLLAFAGTRTQHRMAVRIEDAGFEIRDMIAWVYGSGFPKSHDVSKAIDKLAGVEGEIVSERRFGKTSTGQNNGWNTNHVAATGRQDVRAPATDAAKQWQGWGTALKPSLEPITLARKPLIGTVADNVLAHGTGGINIDGCRVATNGEQPKGSGNPCPHGNADMMSRALGKAGGNITPEAGRWPANLIHDGSDEVVAMFPVTTSGKMKAGTPYPGGNVYGAPSGVTKSDTIGDSGSAARFFYCAKASKKDRDEGLDGFKTATVFKGNHVGRNMENEKNHMGGMQSSTGKNTHPTVKPTDLMRYLCRLVTPPNGIVLDPFMGSGSTGKAAMLEGFSFIGCELSPEYFEIAKARINAINRGTDEAANAKLNVLQMNLFNELQHEPA